jgi:phosphatidylethanolamine/phosphatidyl-N-methylethanolamine N-methyltransferase
MNKSVFFRAWLAAPLKIAAITPSSVCLCRDIARHAYTGADGTLIELGSGTGEIAHALLERGVAAEDLYLVELMPEFCEILRKSFPKSTVLEGDVSTQLAHLIANRSGARPVTTVVSSLPIVWFPLDQQREIINQSFALMEGKGRFLQLTNLPTSPLPMKRLGLRGTPVVWTWSHSVPGIVWSYRRDPV